MVEHAERFLGPVQRGWSTDPDGGSMPFQIVEYEHGSDPESVAYSTLGLSRAGLVSPTSGREIRQELLMVLRRSVPADVALSLLWQVGLTVLESGEALLRGHVVGPAGRLAPETDLTALYVTTPVYFPDELAWFAGADGDVAVAWLVPIGTEEAQLVLERGWDRFEDLVEEQDPDLVDLQRPSMRLAP